MRKLKRAYHRALLQRKDDGYAGTATALASSPQRLSDPGGRDQTRSLSNDQVTILPKVDQPEDTADEPDDSKVDQPDQALAKSATAPSVANDGGSPAAKPNLWREAIQRLPQEDREWIDRASGAAPQSMADVDRVDEIIRLARQLQQKCEAGKLRWAEEPLRASLLWLKRFQEIGDLVTQYDPMHLALPWSGLGFVLTCILRYNEDMQLAAESVERVTRVVQRYRVYELMFGSDPVLADIWPSLNAALLDLYVGLWRLLIRLGRFFGKKRAGRSIHAISKPNEIAESLLSIDKLETEAGHTVSLCLHRQELQSHKALIMASESLQALLPMQSSLLQAQNNILYIVERLEDKDLLSVLEWTSSIKYTFHHRPVSERRNANTCEWIINPDDFNEWLLEASSITLWVQAPGKFF
jgi:hypothetical protein